MLNPAFTIGLNVNFVCELNIKVFSILVTPDKLRIWNLKQLDHFFLNFVGISCRGTERDFRYYSLGVVYLNCLRQCLSLAWGSPNPWTCLSPPLQHWNCKCALPVPTFYMGSVDEIQAFCLYTIDCVISLVAITFILGWPEIWSRKESVTFRINFVYSSINLYWSLALQDLTERSHSAWRTYPARTDLEFCSWVHLWLWAR